MRNNIILSFVFILSVLLVILFHPHEVRAFWNTENHFTGQYTNLTFFYKTDRNLTSNLAKIGGRISHTSPNKVIIQLTNNAQTKIYLKPTVLKQRERVYKHLKSIKIKTFPSNKISEVFNVSQMVPGQISLSKLLRNAPVYQIILEDFKSPLKQSENTIGGLDLYDLQSPSLLKQPLLPFLALFAFSPLFIFLIFNHLFKVPNTYGLIYTILTAVTFHVLYQIFPSLVQVALLSLIIVFLLLFSLQNWIKTKHLAYGPYFWGILLLGVYLRWENILLQGTIPLQFVKASQNYYAQALSMKLFSPIYGFYSAKSLTEPLYPLLIKLFGIVLGFSPFQLFYISLFFSMLLITLVYLLSYSIIKSHPIALMSSLLVSINPLLIQESGLRDIGALLSCCFISFLILIWRDISSWFLRGCLKGGLGLFWSLLHLGALLPLLLLLLIDFAFQNRKKAPHFSFKKNLLSLYLSLGILLIGLSPYLYNSYIEHQTAFVNSTEYISQIANTEFSDQHGFPKSIDLIIQGKKAKLYQQITPKAYFFEYHHFWKFLGSAVLGYIAIGMDSVGNLLGIGTRQNVAYLLIDNLSGLNQQGQFILGFSIEMVILLSIFSFIIIKKREFIFIAASISAVILPHSFFYGLFLSKGLSNLQLQLDMQVFIYILPILSFICSNILYESCQVIIRQKLKR